MIKENKLKDSGKTMKSNQKDRLNIMKKQWSN